MKHLLRGSCALLALALLGCGGHPSTWLTYEHPSHRFSLRYPPGWSVQQEPDFALLSSPAGDVTLGVSVYQRPGSTLDQFVTDRMAVEREKYPTASPRDFLNGSGWRGIAENSFGQAPGEREITQRRMLCVKNGDVFVSLTLYLNPAEYKRNRAQYEGILESLQFLPRK